MPRRQRLLHVVLLLLAMVALASAVVLSEHDAHGIDMTRFRNALLAKAGSGSDFNWIPANVPADFAQEHAPVPTALAQWHSLPGEGDVLTRVLGIARALPRSSSSIEQEQGPVPTAVEPEDSARDGNAFPRALSIARGLSSKPRLGEQIAAPTLATLSQIESTGTGYCVDYTKVFSALAYAAGIPVRQWAFSFEGFGFGHTFNEFWDAEEQRWLMIDVFEGFYPRDTKTGASLSALEFRERLLTSPGSIQWERIAPPLFGFKDDATALQYFQRGANEWYLVWGNLTLSYDEQPLVAFASHFGRLPEQVAAVLTGVQPGVRMMLHDGNRVAFARLMRLRYWLFSAAASEFILLLAFLGACFVRGRRMSSLSDQLDLRFVGAAKRPTMRVLVLSSLFPSATRPTSGVFVRERVRHLRTHCEFVVVAPIPWFPFNRWIRGPEQTLAPFVEMADGMTLYHPRFLCLPGLGKCLDGILYFLCLLPFLGWLRRRFPFDLIDAHFTYPDGLAGVLLAKWFRCPGIVTVRGAHDLRHSRYRLRRPQIRFALTAATRVIAVSASLRDAVSHLGVTRYVRVIPNGVDNSRFRPSDRWAARAALELPQDRTILISVGHIVEGKGHHRVVEVMADLVSRRPDVLCIIVGASIRGDSSREAIDHLVQRYGLAEHVRIVPPRPHGEIPIWLAAADLFCLATRYEGWSNAVMEALACGVPTVTTLVGGNAEIVRDGSDGLLVPFWDRQAFGDAVLRALSIPWDRAAIAARMRAHGWERTGEEVVEEFRLSLGDMSP